MKPLHWIAALAVVASIASAATSASAQQGAVCLEKCRADLKQRGLWSKYPYGHCRRKCDYWVGAEKDRRR